MSQKINPYYNNNLNAKKKPCYNSLNPYSVYENEKINLNILEYLFINLIEDNLESKLACNLLWI
jgi:hypothetical protein